MAHEIIVLEEGQSTEEILDNHLYTAEFDTTINSGNNCCVASDGQSIVILKSNATVFGGPVMEVVAGKKATIDVGCCGHVKVGKKSIVRTKKNSDVLTGNNSVAQVGKRSKVSSKGRAVLIGTKSTQMKGGEGTIFIWTYKERTVLAAVGQNAVLPGMWYKVENGIVVPVQ